MDTVSLRQKLHNYLEVADDKRVKAIYSIMANDIEEAVLLYDEKMQTELDGRYNSFKKGKASVVSAGESKKRIQKILKSSTAK